MRFSQERQSMHPSIVGDGGARPVETGVIGSLGVGHIPSHHIPNEQVQGIPFLRAEIMLVVLIWLY